MTFRYSSYYSGCVLEPLVIILPLAICSFILGIRNFKKKLPTYKHPIFTVIIYCVGAVIGLGLLFSMSIGRLLNGGMYLFAEKETDAVEISGTITQIEGLDYSTLPTMGGARFTIDNISCIVMRKEGFEVGDEVTVVYLPKSGYVLSIEAGDSPPKSFSG